MQSHYFDDFTTSFFSPSDLILRFIVHTIIVQHFSDATVCENGDRAIEQLILSNLEKFLTAPLLKNYHVFINLVS